MKEDALSSYLSSIFDDNKSHGDAAEMIRKRSSNRVPVQEAALEGFNYDKTLNVLDVGCGGGFFTPYLKGRLKAGSFLTGIDMFDVYRDDFMGMCKKCGFGARFFGEGVDVLQEMQDKSYDLVLSSYSLFYFPRIIAKISRLMHPAALFIIITHNEDHLCEITGMVRELLASRGLPCPEWLPHTRLVKNFSGENGQEILGKWFGRIESIAYPNTLIFNASQVDEVQEYFRFKASFFLPEELSGDRIVMAGIEREIRRKLAAGSTLELTKNDTIFRVSEPQYHPV
jgi:SAM-dependent methyltransferase